jgi:hypothetical protein
LPDCIGFELYNQRSEQLNPKGSLRGKTIRNMGMGTHMTRKHSKLAKSVKTRDRMQLSVSDGKKSHRHHEQLNAMDRQLHHELVFFSSLVWPSLFSPCRFSP